MRRDERGASMLEVLIATSLMGLAFTAIVGGMVTSVVGSDIQRDQALADVSARSYAEAIKTAAYVDCAAPSDYAPAAVTYDEPDGVVASVQAVTYWNASEADPNTGAFDAPCGTDEGLQQVTLHVTSGDHAVEVRSFVKRVP